MDAQEFCQRVFSKKHDMTSVGDAEAEYWFEFAEQYCDAKFKRLLAAVENSLESPNMQTRRHLKESLEELEG